MSSAANWKRLLSSPSRACLLLFLAFTATTSPANADSPVVVQQPQAIKVHAGETLQLNVVATGTAPLSYTWYHDRVVVGTGPDNSLSLPRMRGSDAGWYWVKVSNTEGETGSDAVQVRVGTYGEWTVGQGGNGHAYEVIQGGELATDWAQMFRDTYAAGSYLVSYHSLAEENFANSLVPPSQAYRLIGLLQPDGSIEPAGGWQWMSGEPLTYTHWNTGEPNEYGANGINFRGHENMVSTTSTGSWLDIHGGSPAYVVEYPTALVLFAKPTNTVVSGYETAAIRVGAASINPITYTWYLNGSIVPDVTGNVLPTSAALPNGGHVYVQANDGNMSVTSPTVQLSIGPVFVDSPENQVVYQGDAASLAVKATGPGPFTYQWYRDGVEVSGANDSTLAIQEATTDQQGSYDVVVYNAYGSARSASAELVVLPPNSRLVRLEDFEHGAQPGWTIPVTTVPPVGGRRFLGEFGQEAVSLNLGQLPPHTELTISFDLILHGAWQGNAVADDWSFFVDGSPILQTTFSSYTYQSFPNQYFTAYNPPATGSLESNTMGYELVYSSISMLEDTRYRITETVAHNATGAQLTFSSTVANPAETRWSLDNVVVIATSPSGSRLLMTPQGTPGTVNLRIQSQPGTSFTLEQSSDFGTWSFYKSIVNTTGDTTVPVDTAGLGTPVFFRAIGN